VSSGKLPKQASLDVPLCLRTITNFQVSNAARMMSVSIQSVTTVSPRHFTVTCCAIDLSLLSVLLVVKISLCNALGHAP